MSDVAAQVTPGIIAWLTEYARIAVQIFLVMGGFLSAASLAPQGVAHWQPLSKIGQRALRLLAPYSVALLLAVLIAALVRPWFAHDSVPAEPTLAAIDCQCIVLQDISGKMRSRRVSPGVAIDFQLFAAVTLLFAFSRRWARQWLGLQLGQHVVIALTALSLLVFNRHSELDMVHALWAPMGMLAYWSAAKAPSPGPGRPCCWPWVSYRWSWISVCALQWLCAGR